MSASAASMNGSAAPASGKASSQNAASQNSKHQLKTTASGKALDGPRKQAASPVDGNTSKKPAPKAWQGTNPITQRSSAAVTPNGAANGAAKNVPTPTRSPQQAPASATTGSADDAYEPRMLILMSKFVGLNCHITLQSGEKLEGIFSSAALESSTPRIEMKMVKRVALASFQQSSTSDKLNEYIGSGQDHAVAFDLHHIVHLNVPGVQLAPAHGKSSNGVGSSFRTDAEISGAAGGRERELQPWMPGTESQVDMSLDQTAAGWDQFDTNERLFQVKSDYDENLYTTTIDRNDPRYAQREAEARRIAREMERSEPVNAHVAEERRMNANSNAQGGLDEEDMYSGVRRDVAPLAQNRSNNAYIPPSRRPITGQPTVSGAPFDPAIISSQISRPALPTTVNSDTQANATASTAAQAPRANAAAQLPSAASASIPTATISITEAPPTSTRSPAVAASKGPVEGVERKVLDSFKSFANSEKLKVQNHQRALQERNRNSARQEKSVKLNDLKKFAENFKLYSRVPDDLVPILAKTKEKQNEIVTKADQQAREKEHKAKTGSPTPTSTPAKPEVEADSKLTRTAPPGGRPDSNDPASSFNNRQRLPQGFRGPNQPMVSPRAPAGPGLMSHRMQQTQSQHKSGVVNANVPGPIPMADLRIPPSAPSQMREAGLISPDSAASTRFNVKAMEFRPNPAASTFTPGPGKTSPEETKRPSVSPATTSPPQFFSKDVKPPEERTPYDAAFNAIKRMADKVKAGDEKIQAQYANNGGIPQAYRTQPRWEVLPSNSEKTYVQAFPPLATPVVSPLHTPSIGSIPHQNQLPPHLQQNVPPQMPSAQNTPRFFPAQPQHMPNQHMDEHTRMQYASSNSSVQPSPRMGHPSMAYAGPMHPQMQNFPGAMPPYMNPAMQMRPMQSGPQFGPQGPQMGGHMMVQQPSNGPFMNGPMAQPMQMYPSPGLGYVQPHFPNHPQHPGGYAASPRAHPMSHQGSQQGHQPGQPFMVPPGSQMMMQPHPGQMAQMRNFPQGQFQGGPHPGYNMQHRQMSGGGYNNHQMTPRQNHAAPHQGPSPGNGPPMHAGGPGDEGK